MNDEQQLYTLNLVDIAEMVRKNKELIIIFTLLTTLLGGIISNYAIPPKYKSSADILVRVDPANNSQALIKTIAEFLNKEVVLDNAIDELGLNLKISDIKAGLRVDPANNFIKLSYVSTNPEMTDEVVNAIIESAIDIVNKEECFAALKDRFTRASTAKDGTYDSPNIIMYSGIGSFLGIILSGGIIFSKEIFSNTYRSKEELENCLNINVLGAIPEYKIKKDKYNH